MRKRSDDGYALLRANDCPRRTRNAEAAVARAEKVTIKLRRGSRGPHWVGFSGALAHER